MSQNRSIDKENINEKTMMHNVFLQVYVCVNAYLHMFV